MVKKFAGQVKVADVQTAFDEVVGRVNSLVDSYNSQAFVKHIDYTVGGPTLAPAGYTLTVGGYKQFLNAAEGCVVGCKPIRTDDNHFKVTAGMLVAKNGIYKLPDSVLAIPTDKKYRTLYFNTVNKQYEWTQTGSSVLVEKEIEFGSNLYNACSDKVLYAYKSSVYNKDIVGATISAGSWNWGTDLYNDVTLFKASGISGNNINLDIEDYPHILSKYEVGSKIIRNAVGCDSGTIRSECVLFGTLSEDKKHFSPKIFLASGRANYYGDYGLIVGENPELKLDNTYSKPTLELHNTAGSTIKNISTIWSDDHVAEHGQPGEGYVVYEVKRDDVSGKDMIVFYYRCPDGYDTYNYGSGGQITYTLKNNISSYNINCCIILNLRFERVCTEYEGIYASNVIADNANISMSHGFDPTYRWVESLSGEKSYINLGGTKKVYVVEEVGGESISYRVCDINTNSSSDYMSTNVNVQNERINGTYKITNESKSYENYWVKSDLNEDTGGSFEKSPWYQELDTSNAPKFVNMMPSVARATSKHGSGTDCEAFLFGEDFYLNSGQKERAVQLWLPSTYLFVPKGVKNPYTTYHPVGSTGSTDLKYSSQKVLKVIIDKKIDDKSE